MSRLSISGSMHSDRLGYRLGQVALRPGISLLSLGASGRFAVAAAVSVVFALASGCGRTSSNLVPPPQKRRAEAPIPLADAEERVRRSPNDADGYVALARSLRAQDRPRAARSLRAALKRDPVSSAAFKDLCLLYEESGYTDRLLELLEDRLKRVPSDLESMLRAESIYTSIEALADARALVDKADKIAPENPHVAGARASFHYHTGHFDAGAAILRAAISTHPNDPSLFHQLSEMQRAAGHFTDAEASIRSSINLKQDSALYHRQLAHILITGNRKERLPEAEQEARHAIALGDSDVDAKYWLALAFDIQKRRNDAIAAYEDVARIDLRYDRTAYRLGRLYQESDRLEEGRKLLALYAEMDRNRQKVADAVSNLRKNPDQAAAWFKLASIYRITEPPGQAVALLRYSLRRFPSDAHLKKELREALEESGRHTEAAILK